MDQLEEMGCERFDIGVKRVDGAMILREGWGTRQVLKSLLWFWRENLNRGHIYVRPSGAHGLSLLDDLKARRDRADEGGRTRAGAGCGDVTKELSGLAQARSGS